VLLVARHIFVGMSARMQTRPKFGSSLHRRRLIAQSVCVLPLLLGGPLVSDHDCFVSCAPHQFSGLHREMLRHRFQLRAAINGAGSLATIASNSAPPSTAFGDRVLFPL
jgi:hypothetical protein